MWFDEVKKLKTKLEITKQEIRNNHNRLLEISAEFENYKKRSAREMNDIRKFSNESLLRELLFVTDNLELSLKSSQKTNMGLIEGVTMTLKGALNILTKFKG